MRRTYLSAAGCVTIFARVGPIGGLWAIERVSPPSRTGLLTTGPSNLKNILGFELNQRPLVGLSKGSYLCALRCQMKYTGIPVNTSR
jgi:hypothetical protein